ncbi:MAG: hypothetical protein ABJX32_04760 [Tateyamaria sp.]|uniref:hypothetical protein n=1 Tax=Tateyamaria sp. TaxID=1929288 RepID=UPI00329D2BE9
MKKYIEVLKKKYVNGTFDIKSQSSGSLVARVSEDPECLEFTLDLSENPDGSITEHFYTDSFGDDFSYKNFADWVENS